MGSYTLSLHDALPRSEERRVGKECIKALANQGYGRKEIASKAGLHPFVAGKNMEQAKRFKMGQLRRVMEEGAQLEQDVKTGLLTDNLAVELFIVKQSER